MTKPHSSAGRSRRVLSVIGALAAATAVAVALPTSAGYTDVSHARSESLPVRVEPPFEPGIAKNARMVDTALGLGNDGNVYVWGRTDMGMNGAGAGSGSPSGPVKVVLPEGESRQVASGIYNINALTQDGTVWGWGYYPARDGTDAAKPNGEPRQIRINSAWNGSGELLDKIAVISSTEYAGAGIRSDGSVWHWGENTGYGGKSGAGASQLAGLPDHTVAGNRPVYLKGAYTNFFVILENGDVYYWGGTGGSSLPGGAGNAGATASYLGALSPWMKQNVAAGSPYIVAIDGGINMGAALLSDGQVLSWSRNDALGWRTGRGLPTTPAIIPTLGDISSMQFGFTGVAMLNSANELWGYGASDDYGRFPMSPTLIDTDVRQFAAGQGYYIWQRGDQTFWGRGYNVQGAIGLPTSLGLSTNRQVSFDLGMLVQ